MTTSTRCVFAPLPPSLQTPIATRASLVNSSSSRPGLAAGTSDAPLIIPPNCTAVSLFRRHLGDAGFRELPFVRDPSRYASLRVVDLSNCGLTLNVCGDLFTTVNGLARLEELALVGNFVHDFGAFNKLTLEGDTIKLAVAHFMAKVCDAFEAHPTLQLLHLDPWLTARHTRFLGISSAKARAAHSAILRQRVVGAVTSSTSSVVGGATQRSRADDDEGVTLQRADTTVSFRPQAIESSLLLAAENAAATSAATSGSGGNARTAAALRSALLDVQLSERSSRDKILRIEARLRAGSIHRAAAPPAVATVARTSSLMGPSSSLPQQQQQRGGVGSSAASPAASSPGAAASRTGASRALVQAAASMVELEEEIRGLLERKESDSLAKIVRAAVKSRPKQQ